MTNQNNEQPGHQANSNDVAKIRQPAPDQTALIEAWLTALKARLPELTACVVLLDGESSAFEWRQNTDIGDSPAVIEALRGAARLARRSAHTISTHERQTLTIALRFTSPTAADTSLGSCAIALDSTSIEEQSAIEEISDACRWFSQFYARRVGTGLSSAVQSSWIAALLESGSFEVKIQRYVDHIVDLRAVDRAAIGVVRGHKISRVAISGQRRFSRRSPLQHRLRQTMSAAFEQWTKNASYTPELVDHGLTLLVPLRDGDRIIAVLHLDRRDGRKFIDDEIAAIASEACVAGALVALAERAERDPISRVKRGADGLIPKSKSHRVALLAIAAAIALAAMFPLPTVITSDARIEGELQRALVAPMDSYLDQVHVLAGEQVQQGELLATFAIEDLTLERLKWQGERARKIKAKRDAAARQERAKLGVIEAEIAQANAEIALVDAQIARRELRAPVGGAIISGDLTQRLGAPIERGEVLFEIVPGANYRFALLLDEQDVKQVSVGDEGKVKLNAFPNQPVSIDVLRITPVSETNADGNFFLAYAKIRETDIRLRPGMRGVAKLVVGKRAAIINWTASFRRWFSLKRWQWLG